jgi:hypothetical protein
MSVPQAKRLPAPTEMPDVGFPYTSYFVLISLIAAMKT